MPSFGRWKGDSLANKVPTHFDDVLVASAARTVSGDSGVLSGYAPYTSATFTLDVTAAATDANDTLDVYIQRQLPSGDYEDIAAFTQALGNGGAVGPFRADVYAGGDAATDEYSAAPNDAALTAGSVAHLAWGDKIRVKWVIVDPTGSNASFTFEVKANWRV